MNKINYIFGGIIVFVLLVAGYVFLNKQNNTSDVSTKNSTETSVPRILSVTATITPTLTPTPNLTPTGVSIPSIVIMIVTATPGQPTQSPILTQSISPTITSTSTR